MQVCVCLCVVYLGCISIQFHLITSLKFICIYKIVNNYYIIRFQAYSSGVCFRIIFNCMIIQNQCIYFIFKSICWLMYSHHSLMNILSIVFVSINFVVCFVLCFEPFFFLKKHILHTCVLNCKKNIP